MKDMEMEAVNKRVKTMDGVCRILEKYKGVYVPFGHIDLSEDGSYLIVKPKDMKLRNMPFAAKRILNRFPELRTVHFTGGWQEHVYTRETLKWMAI